MNLCFLGLVLSYIASIIHNIQYRLFIVTLTFPIDRETFSPHMKK